MGVYNKILEQVADGTTHVDLRICLNHLDGNDKLDNPYSNYFYRKTSCEWYVRCGNGNPYRKKKGWKMHTYGMEAVPQKDLMSLDGVKGLARLFPDV